MSYDITSRFFHWMEANNITRADAAKALGVDERSLSTYRSRGLPRKKGARAEQIMREHQQATSPPESTGTNQISVVFSNEDYELVEKAANLTRCTSKEFIHKATCTAARKEIDARQLKVAEHPVTYQTPHAKHS
jgi:hypothetical protein